MARDAGDADSMIGGKATLSIQSAGLVPSPLLAQRASPLVS
jgi:hypothetical protein